MSVQDKNQRTKAIPYFGQVCGYNRSAISDNDVSVTFVNQNATTDNSDTLKGYGDLGPIIRNVSQNDYMIRILRPKFGHIIQAYLNIGITFAAAETSPKFNISVGNSFQADGLTANTSSSTYISSCMNQLSPPNGTPFTGTAGQPLTFYKINIQPLIPQVGATNYTPDFYSIGLHFPTAPTMSGLFHLSKFFITGSILVY